MLNIKSDRYDIVIDDNDTENHLTITKEMILNWLKDNSYSVAFFALIYHDKDTAVVNGNVVPKLNHYHLTLEFTGQRSANTILNDMAMSWNCNKNLIQIKLYDNWCQRVRYLTHSDNAEKYQYSRDEVLTNNTFMYDEYFNCVDSKCLDMLTLRLFCVEYNTIWEVYNRVGLSNARKYRQIITDTWFDREVFQERHCRINEEKNKALYEALQDERKV